MTRMIRKIIDYLTLNFFYKIPSEKVPRWVLRASDKYYDKSGVRPYNKIIFLKGKHRIYKIWFEMIGQGQIDTHYYSKRKTY